MAITHTRCAWVPAGDALYEAYHDEEWGVPVHDDRRLFEFLVLEGAQAGLSWRTILNKRDGYRRAFDGFDIATVAAYGPEQIAVLLADPGIVRNRLKVAAAVRLAGIVLEIQREYGSLDAFLWGFASGAPRQNAWNTLADLPARTPESDAMSAALRARGATFVGSTICYSFMQAVGMVNDHTTDCYRHAEVEELAAPDWCQEVISTLCKAGYWARYRHWVVGDSVNFAHSLDDRGGITTLQYGGHLWREGERWIVGIGQPSFPFNTFYDAVRCIIYYLRHPEQFEEQIDQ